MIAPPRAQDACQQFRENRRVRLSCGRAMSTSLAASLADILRRELDGTHPLIVIDTDDETEVRETAPNAIDASIEARHWSALRGICY